MKQKIVAKMFVLLTILTMFLLMAGLSQEVKAESRESIIINLKKGRIGQQSIYKIGKEQYIRWINNVVYYSNSSSSKNLKPVITCGSSTEHIESVYYFGGYLYYSLYDNHVKEYYPYDVKGTVYRIRIDGEKKEKIATFDNVKSILYVTQKKLLCTRPFMVYNDYKNYEIDLETREVKESHRFEGVNAILEEYGNHAVFYSPKESPGGLDSYYNLRIYNAKTDKAVKVKEDFVWDYQFCKNKVYYIGSTDIWNSELEYNIICCNKKWKNGKTIHLKVSNYKEKNGISYQVRSIKINKIDDKKLYYTITYACNTSGKILGEYEYSANLSDLK